MEFRSLARLFSVVNGYGDYSLGAFSKFLSPLLVVSLGALADPLGSTRTSFTCDQQQLLHGCT